MRLPRPSFPQALRRRAPIRVWLAALGTALLVPALTAVASLSVAAFDNAEHWTADWRTVLGVAPPPGQHDALALVLIDEETLERFEAPARSPTDRRLLAQLIRAIDGAHPRAIVFDMKTAADDDLIEAIRSAAAPVVMGVSAPPSRRTPRQAAFQNEFWKRTGRPAGYLNMAIEPDGVARRQGEPNPPPGAGLSFAERLVQAAGKPVEHQPRRIVWRADPWAARRSSPSPRIFCCLASTRAKRRGAASSRASRTASSSWGSTSTISATAIPRPSPRFSATR
jgi:CHASE2 domain-containing sensor protein